MSKNGWILGGLALVVAIVALVLQFVGPTDTATADGGLAAQIEELSTDVDLLKGRTTTPTLRIGYVNAETAFNVFVGQVAEEREVVTAKTQEVLAAQQAYAAGTLSKTEYEQKSMLLQGEGLQASLNVNLAIIDLMLANSGFSDIHATLQKLRTQAEPLETEMTKLVETAQVGVVDSTQYANRYSQLKSAISELESLVSQAASAKIVQVTQTVAAEEGIDLVINSKNVVVYRNTAKIVDLTTTVSTKLETLF